MSNIDAADKTCHLSSEINLSPFHIHLTEQLMMSALIMMTIFFTLLLLLLPHYTNLQSRYCLRKIQVLQALSKL